MPDIPLVGAADIAAYRRDGATVIRNALDRETVALLEQGIEEAFHSLRPSTDVESTGGGRTVVRDYASLDSPGLQRLLRGGLPGRVAAALMQTPSAHLILDQIFYKLSGSILPTPWHQDTPFLRVRGDALIRLWMPCDRSPRDVTVQVVRGSHRWNVVFNGEVRQAPDIAQNARSAAGVGDAWLPSPPDVARYRESFDILSWDVEPGDILVFQGNMLHGADGHPGSDSPRRAFAVLMGGPELRYHKPSGKAFPSPGRKAGAIATDDIAEGSPIGDHETAFPRC